MKCKHGADHINKFCRDAFCGYQKVPGASRTDSERLDWMIESHARVFPYADGWTLKIKDSQRQAVTQFLRDTPRAAIDAAMDQEKNKI